MKLSLCNGVSLYNLTVMSPNEVLIKTNVSFSCACVVMPNNIQMIKQIFFIINRLFVNK